MKTKTNKKVQLQGELPKNVPKLKELAEITRKLTQFCRDNNIALFLAAEIKYKEKGYAINAIDGNAQQIERIIVDNLNREPALKWAVMRHIIGKPNHAVLHIQAFKSMKEFKERKKGGKK